MNMSRTIETPLTTHSRHCVINNKHTII